MEKSFLSAHPFRAWVAALILLAALGAVQACLREPSPQEPKAAKSEASAADSAARNALGEKTRIGVYDSRAVTVAYAGSEIFKRKIDKLMADEKAAKAAGDQQKAAELQMQGQEQQYRFHIQGFSTAPVDDILAEIKDQLPAIQQQAGVGALVSKWDTASLAKHQGTEQVDVTGALIDAFNPKPQSRKAAEEIQTKEPMPLAQAQKYFREHPEK